jgi:hypothetical protein
MMSSPQACNESGCFYKAVSNGYCAKHQAASSRMKKHVMDETDKRYHRAPWPAFRKLMLCQNPICQRIEKGRQCRNAATLVHHLWSPRVRPDLFVDPKNVVCLCVLCHTPEDGTPWWREGKEFVKTEFTNPNVGGSYVQVSFVSQETQRR